jgi:hypothetical protein
MASEMLQDIFGDEAFLHNISVALESLICQDDQQNLW